MKLNGHPAPGLKGRLGYYMGARFSVPENPIMRGASPCVRAQKMIDRIDSTVINGRPRNALGLAMAHLSGCAMATPVVHVATGTGQVAVAEPEPDTPLWMHIAFGGVLSALALYYIGKGR